MSCLYEEKNVYFSSLYTFSIQCFYFLKGQVHKDSKLAILINMGKSRLVKAIFTNNYKMSDACANSFGRYIMTAQCMRNVFFFIKFMFLRKNGFSEKIKAHFPQHPQAFQQLFSPHIFNFIQKNF